MKKRIFIASAFFNFIFALLVVRHYMLLPRAKENSKLIFFAGRDKVLQKLPKKNTDILFVGDSQIQGFEVAEFFNSLNVKNRGIYYDNSGGVLHRSNDLAAGKPAKIFIEIGTNDLNANMHLDSVKKNVTRTIDLIRASSPKTELYLLGVLPFGDDTEINNQRLKLNVIYSDLARNKATFIALDKYFSRNRSFYVDDKVHLSGAGYKKLYEVLKPFVTE